MRARRSLVLALTLAACGGDDGGGDLVDAPLADRATAVVLRYDYELDLETRAAATALTVRVEVPGRCLALPSRAAALDLGSVRLDDAPLAATWSGTELEVCGEMITAGEHTLSATITQQPLERWGQSQVGYTVTPDGSTADPESYFYLISWVGGCDRFGPCDTRPDQFAQYRFTIHHRSGVRALCPGTVTTADTTTTCDFTHDGGPTYSTFGFIAYASWAETSRGDWGGIATKLFERPGAAFPVAGYIDDAYHAGFLTWMQSTFGAYPYGDELRVVVAPTYWSGFEHPGNIVLDSGLTRPGTSAYTRPVAHVLNHEIAHQWAGDETTLADTYDFVWKEAMAEYLAFVYEDMNNPAEALATARAWKSFAVGAAYHPVPEDAPRPALLDYYGEVYGPGPMILFRQLEGLSSRADVIEALQMLLGSERAISVGHVQAALEATTGLDLDAYFYNWVRGAGAPVWPTFRTEVLGVAPSQMVRVTETTPGGVLHGCNFAVELRGAAGESTKVAITRGVGGAVEVMVPTGVVWPVVSTVLDPDAQCLAYAASAFTAPPRHAPGWSPWRGSLADAPVR